MGEIYEADYPFVRVVWDKHWRDEEGGGVVATPSWKPGAIWQLTNAFGGCDCICHGVGKVIYEVYSRHKPGPRFPERIFYTRQWQSPDGKRFGKTGLRMTTTRAFERKKRGWWLDEEYIVRDPTPLDESEHFASRGEMEDYHFPEGRRRA